MRNPLSKSKDKINHLNTQFEKLDNIFRELAQSNSKTEKQNDELSKLADGLNSDNTNIDDIMPHLNKAVSILNESCIETQSFTKQCEEAFNILKTMDAQILNLQAKLRNDRFNILNKNKLDKFKALDILLENDENEFSVLYNKEKNLSKRNKMLLDSSKRRSKIINDFFCDLLRETDLMIEEHIRSIEKNNLKISKRLSNLEKMIDYSFSNPSFINYDIAQKVNDSFISNPPTTLEDGISRLESLFENKILIKIKDTTNSSGYLQNFPIDQLTAIKDFNNLINNERRSLCKQMENENDPEKRNEIFKNILKKQEERRIEFNNLLTYINRHNTEYLLQAVLKKITTRKE